ncbi:MAG: nitrate reductase gamma subunit [Parasphingorhabdus sp.]|jgi:nitrate reductase gamma subunit
MTDFILGPLWTAAVWIFTAGVIWRITIIFYQGFRKDKSIARSSGVTSGFMTIFRRFLPRSELLKRSRFLLIAGYMFHLGLLTLLFFAAPHVEFIEQYLLGFSWTPLPHWAFILSAELAFAGLILLWLRRLTHPVTRLLSNLDDYLAAALTFLAMLTGCLALLESFEGLRVLHVLGTELLMIYFPFSSLTHAFTIFISRGATGSAAGRHGVTV